MVVTRRGHAPSGRLPAGPGWAYLRDRLLTAQEYQRLVAWWAGKPDASDNLVQFLIDEGIIRMPGRSGEAVPLQTLLSPTALRRLRRKAGLQGHHDTETRLTAWMLPAALFNAAPEVPLPLPDDIFPAYSLQTSSGARIELTPGHVCRLGSAPDNDAIVDLPSVDAHHAVIDWDGGVPVVHDLESEYGTYVNEERVTRQALAPRDLLRIGPRVYAFAKERHTSDSTRLIGREETSEEQLMTGQLAETGLPDLLQFFSSTNKSGTVFVDDGERAGQMIVRKGSIVYAEFDGHHGAEAVYRMLALERGAWRFGRAPSEEGERRRNVSGSTIHLIMEGLRRKDEMDRAQPVG